MPPRLLGRELQARSFTPPPAFEEYRLLRVLGRGAMGQVFLAEDTLLQRAVAIKFIATASPDAALRERLLTEARAVARLQHESVVAVHRVGEVEGCPYLVSEYLRGRSLDRVDKPLTGEQVLAIAIDLARGLGAAHRAGVLHRDVKPANAFLTEEGRAKLLDFGLAKLLEAPAPLAAAAPAEPLVAAEGLGATRSRPSLPGGQAESALAETRARPSLSGGQAEAALAETGARPSLPGGQVAEAALAETGARGGSAPEPPAVLGLTGVGSVLGTPLYMAPEAWRGEPQSRAADVYSLGALLHELACGEPPHRAASLEALRLAVLEGETPALLTRAPHLDPRLCALIDRCLRRAAAERPASGEELAQALAALRDRAPGPAPGGDPYRGLHAFEAAHRALFFGRDRDARALLERLRAEPLVLCAGDSGVGKSSLCRAAVLPLAEEEGLGEGRAWRSLTLVPGARPVLALAQALLRLRDAQPDPQRAAAGEDGHEGPRDPAADGGERRSGSAVDDLHARLLAAPTELPRLLRLALGLQQGLLVFIDQAEELLTLAEAPERAAAVLALGALATPTPGLRLLLCARGDHLTRLAALPRLGPALARALYLLRPLDEAGLREAITEPARRAGVTFESEALVEALVAAAAGAAGGLPLLQFALGELWAARDRGRRQIAAAALDALGGVAGALARHADQVVAALRPAERAAARRLLPRLVTREGTRARRGEAELCGADPAERAALQALVRGRLLVAVDGDAPPGGDGAAYEVAHEALLHGWGALRGWLAEDADLAAARERLLQAALEWERLGRAREALYGARQLAEVARVGLAAAALPTRGAAFLQASRRARVRARALQVGGALLLPLLALSAFTASSLRQRRARAAQVALRLSEGALSLQAARALRAAVDREREAAFTALRGRDVEAGERRWAQALALYPEAEAAYRKAGRALEAGLLLDPARRDVRGRYADLLAEQVVALESGLSLGPRDDLWQRLANLDDDGSRRAALEAPARVRVRVPALLTQTSVLAQRYQPQGGRLVLSPGVSTPAAEELRLPPGSWLLTVRAPGRPPVRAPLLVQRGEALELRLPVPARVPEGMVYVPPGRFLFGWGEDEQVRRIFGTVPPQHPVVTAGYFIGAHEVTFGAWLRYLKALPPSARAGRLPRVTRVDQGQHLRLVESDGAFALDLQPRAERLRAREGERVLYAARTLRREQDWLRWPVAGVRHAAAAEYAAWLAQSGQLPGARLCDEYEWERAARGADGRVYPHGAELAPDDANHDLTYGRAPRAFGPDEVGSHPASDSPFGVSDLAGNVWEWTRSVLKPGEIVYRGGSWYLARPSARSMNREVGDASLADVDIGFRVCQSAPDDEPF